MTTFSDILGEPVSLEGKGGFQITYQPSALTPNILKRFAAFRQQDVEDADVPGLLDAYCELLPSFVLSWDLVDANGPIPLEPAALADVPVEILDYAFTLINEDREARASEEKNVSNASTEASQPGHMTPATTASPPNGTGSPQLVASGDAVLGNS